MPTESTVHVRVSQSRSQWGRTALEKIQQMIERIPSEMRSGSTNAIEILNRSGEVALEQVKKAFIAKSRGGTDEAGESWQPLLPRTVAYTRKAGRNKLERSRNTRPSQALTKNQQDRWWEVYRQGLAAFKGDKSHAARRAWFILKKEGATTLLDKYGGMRVDILRNTGQLFDSIGVKVDHGEIVISATHKAAAAHHYGVPGHLPQRRLWPDPGKWPSSWWEKISEPIRDGIISLLKEDLGSGDLE